LRCRLVYPSRHSKLRLQALIRMTNSTEYNRFWWHSRRGMLELDLILLPFLEANYASFDAAEIERYRAFLESEDQDLFSWLVTGREPEPAHIEMVATIREYVRTR